MTAPLPIENPLFAQLQAQLTHIYALPESEDVRRFLIDADTYRSYSQINHLDPLERERIFLRCHEDNSVDLGLYLNEEVLQNLSQHHPFEGLDQRNLADFFSVVEGVSHYLFISFRTQTELPTSALELELQAEIDKFIIGFLFEFARHKKTRCAEDIHRILFQNFRLKQGLSEKEKTRYQTASRTAAKFCKFLEGKFMQPRMNWQKLLSFLRRFYRLSAANKFSSITSAIL